MNATNDINKGGCVDQAIGGFGAFGRGGEDCWVVDVPKISLTYVNTANHIYTLYADTLG